MRISGWGRYPEVEAEVCYSDSADKIKSCLSDGKSRIAFGFGRSYGDSALNTRIVKTRPMDKMLSFNVFTGILTCEAGVSFSEIVDVFLPRGWFPAVTPGTKNVSVGGAIASDVHGKNHHHAGCFSNCVLSFELMIADGSILKCSRRENSDLFRATCGGMGLTGIVLQVDLQLVKVDSAFIRQKTIKAGNLREVFELFKAYAPCQYSVAWIDCLSKGKYQGRSLLMVGEHADDGRFYYREKRGMSIPVNFPGFALNKHSVKLFNALYYGKVFTRTTESLVTVDDFFYPLDAIDNWNRIYGGQGFLQYQFVIPEAASFEALQKILSKIADAGSGSFLSVLKLLGAENENYLSFPMKGYTLALDFKFEKKLFALFEKLDRIVLDYDGRLYLTKDARMGRKMVESGYPQLEAFKSVRRKYKLDNIFNSFQSIRLGM